MDREGAPGTATSVTGKPFLAAPPPSDEVRLCLQGAQRGGRWFSAAEPAARSAIRDGAIDRIGRSAHPGQQRTDLPRCDPNSELLRQTSSQFVIRQILAEEPNKIICVMSIENHVAPSMELRLKERARHIR